MNEMYAKLEEPLVVGNYRIIVYKYNSKKEKMDMYDVCEGIYDTVDKWLYRTYPNIVIKDHNGTAHTNLYEVTK